MTFGSITFAEVTDISWSYGGALPKGRGSTWTDDIGNVTLSCLSSTGISTGNYGTIGTLTISGGGSGLTHRAIYEGLTVTPELNGVTRYAVTFRLTDA